MWLVLGLVLLVVGGSAWWVDRVSLRNIPPSGVQPVKPEPPDGGAAPPRDPERTMQFSEPLRYYEPVSTRRTIRRLTDTADPVAIPPARCDAA